MNLPRNGCCCCCSEDCGSSNLADTIHHSANIGVNGTEEREQGSYSVRPARRKRLSSFSTLRKTTQRHCAHLIFVFSALLLSAVVGLGNTSEIPLNSNSFPYNGESTPAPFGSPAETPSIPTAASSSLNNVVVPGPSSSSPTALAGSSASITQSYFINGYANQIQKTNVTDLRALAGNNQFKLWFRTVCPFGNIVNDDKFALRFNGQGYLTYLELPQEAQHSKSKDMVTDGQWHSVTFVGPLVYLDDREITDVENRDSPNISINWDTSSDNDTLRKLYFFDGFVGCIRLEVPVNSSATINNPDAPAASSLSSSYQTEDPFVLSKLFNLKGLQKYQPCNNPEFDLSSSAQCFQPENFLLCSKCENNAECVFTDGKNECKCGEPEDESIRYHPPYCSMTTDEPTSNSFDEQFPESRELHSSSGDQNEPVISTTRSSRTSSVAQSSFLMSSTTEHMAAPSSIEQSRLPLETTECPCLHGGTCISPSEDNPHKICNCSGTEFRGRTCNNDVCAEMPDACGSFGRCWDDPTRESGYECYCKPGFAGDGCDINFDECLSNPCVNNGTCTDGVNTYNCTCQPGFTGKNCEHEIDECASNPCEHGSTCTDLIADYACACTAGFNGTNCEIDINECESDPCENQGICDDLVNDYSCNCNDTGFNGRNCEFNIDDCANNPCQNEGNCSDGIKAYTCECYPGYEGINCENDIEECNMNPCKNGGTCYEKSNPEHYGQEYLQELEHLQFHPSTAAGYVCGCVAGYNGTNCEHNIDECQIESPCNGHGRCIDGVNNYTCECFKGFKDQLCETDINECEPNPCEQAKECKNLEGDYACECNDGYGGKNCTVALTGCITNICYNEGSCKPDYDEATDTHSFECTCKQGYTGDTCQTKTTMAFNGSSFAEIVLNDDAYANNKYYLTFQFKTTLPDVVLAVGQGGTYFYLGLTGGKLNLQSSLINNLQGMSSGSNLHDGKWHKVVVSINSSHAILSADIEQVTLPIAEVEDFTQQPTGFNFTILGSLKSTLGFLNKQDLNPFVGCMQDVRINDENILPQDAINVNLTNILPTCHRRDQCNPNPCNNGGTCKDLWLKFTCNCPRPHLGERCQYSYIAATFNHETTQNSLATVDIPPGRFAGVFDISMFVRTREPRGTIFLLCDKERGLNGSYIEASVTKSGNLVVQAKWTGQAEPVDEAGGKPEPYTVDGLISDGNPHLITVQKDRNFVVIKVDDSEHFRKSHSNKVFNPNVMYIGGRPAFLSGQEPVVQALVQEGHSGETSTSLPETPIDNNTEGTALEIEVGSESTVPEQFRFKGTIQDVRINLSTSELSPSLGHTSHQKIQSVYIVEFFNLTEIHQMGNPLGRVTTQNLLEGTVTDDHCKSSPCFHGVCNNTWNDYKCACYDQYDGKQCDVRLLCADVNCPERSVCKNIGHVGFECVVDAAFDGKGHIAPHYVLKSNSPADVNISELSFRYRSKRPRNVIHISNGTSFLRASLEGSGNDSYIAFHFMNDVALIIQNSTIFDGEWHSVAIRFSSLDNADYTFGLVYDKVEKLEKSENEDFPFKSNLYLKDMLLSPNVDIVVGTSLTAGDFSRPMSTDGENSHGNYRGCLRDIYIGSYRLPFTSQTQLGNANPEIANRTLIETTAPTAFYINERFVTSEQHLPRLGCVLCYEKDCRNQGQCTNPNHSYECTCVPGYEGEFCEVNINECIGNMCSDGSTCNDGINNYTCSCAKGYEGWLCNIDINECEENGPGEEKCNYNGLCEDQVGEYKCMCNDDYTGTHCDKRKKSTCDDQPCENDATCHDIGLQPNGVSFNCVCGQGWEGEFCSERIDYCKDVLCENEGNCTNKLFGYQCNCVSGFDGPHCEYNIDECTPNQCKNNGICIDGINSFTCSCNGKFKGQICDEDVDECVETPEVCPDHLVCENLIGSYICSCPDKNMCGSDCNILNPCFLTEGNYTCENGGTCEAHCDDHEEEPHASCNCLPQYNGERCENFFALLAPAESGSVDILLIIIPVLAAILIAATVGIIILVRMARRKRATRGVYSPSQQEYCNPRVELDNVMKPPPEERLI